MVKKISNEEVLRRDQEAECYHYFKPMKGEIYRGLKGKRRHYCENCGAVSLLAPEYFWRGRGCQNCSSKRGKDQQLDPEEVAERDKKAPCNNTYPPEPNQKYVSQHRKRSHICSVCGHRGKLSPKAYWGGTGCPVCGVEKAALTRVENSARFVAEKDRAAKCIDTYPPISEYKGVAVHRQHKCNVCGYVGSMKPDNFWHNGRGCPKCGIKLGSSNKRKNMKSVVPDRDRKSVHFKSYPPVSEYTGAFEHRVHRCKVCGHEGRMTPNNFWRGRGCPVCADSGFDKSAPAILYYLRIDRRGNRPLYKIGITNRTVQERFNNPDLELISVIKEWSFDFGSEAYQEEQRLIKGNRRHKYSGEPVLQSGNNELFTADILGLDELPELGTINGSGSID